jgi:hypothetical protein
MTDLAWLLYDGDPSAGGMVIASGSGLDATGWSNIYRVLDTSSGNTDRPIMYDVANMGGMYLPQGDYWLAWQTNGSLGSGPWAPPITINGQTTTGNGLQSLDNGATWAAALDGGTGTAQGLPFIIEGQVSGGGGDLCSMPSDIPWASVTPDNGTTTPGNTTTVDVEFDATGLLAGTYTGVLCVRSNDPDPGTGNGTELVIVELEMVVQTPTDVSLSSFSGSTNAAVLPMLVAMVAALVAGFGLILRRRSVTE